MLGLLEPRLAPVQREGDTSVSEQQTSPAMPPSAPSSIPDSSPLPPQPPCPPPLVAAPPAFQLPLPEQILEPLAELVQDLPDEMENTASPLPSANGTAEKSDGPADSENKSKKLPYCSLCKVTVNSMSQLEAHNKGTKHKTILEARSGLGPIKAYPRLGLKVYWEQGSQDSSTRERTFHCEICNVKANSEVQIKEHISSRRHRDGVAGRPNPLLSQHKKQRTMAELATSMVFPKDLPKSLAAGLLPNPLAFAAAMAAAANSPLAMRPSPTPPLLQAPHHLTHPLLRSAPGPIRTAHGPILFSPY